MPVARARKYRFFDCVEIAWPRRIEWKIFWRVHAETVLDRLIRLRPDRSFHASLKKLSVAVCL